MPDFTHIDENGRTRMVDVSDKAATDRRAVARGTIRLHPETLKKIDQGALKKGNVFETARIAGVMAAKNTAAMIPMCHPLNITHVAVDFSVRRESAVIDIRAAVNCRGRTGVEMEALTAVSVAALTIYDMCKSCDKTMVIADIQLIEKSGGKSGHFQEI